MKFALLALASAAIIPAAFATPVTYDTLQTQLCVGAMGCGTNTQVLGAVRVTFSPLNDTTVDPTGLGGNFTFASFGNLVMSCVGGGTGCGSASLAGLNLYIVVDQSNPVPGTGNIPAGVITGSLSGTASSAQITWPTPAATTINGFTYSVRNNPLAVMPVSSNGGVTSIQAKVTEVPVPEPSTYMMFSAGLLALGLRRKFAKRA